MTLRWLSILIEAEIKDLIRHDKLLIFDCGLIDKTISDETALNLHYESKVRDSMLFDRFEIIDSFVFFHDAQTKRKSARKHFYWFTNSIKARRFESTNLSTLVLSGIRKRFAKFRYLYY